MDISENRETIRYPTWVDPTPWYMTSFLYRFHNGSSSLKILPENPTTICDSFVKYDEWIPNQTYVPELRSIGQPVFSQAQTISGMYEVRTPWYRAIRADVNAHQATPTYGDVRTCIRAQSKGGIGSQSEPLPLLEAAGDDFNFFFMVGPPPMMDVRKIDTNAQRAVLPTNIQVAMEYITIGGSVINDKSKMELLITSWASYPAVLKMTNGKSKILDANGGTGFEDHITQTYRSRAGASAEPIVVLVPWTDCSFYITQDGGAQKIILQMPRYYQDLVLETQGAFSFATQLAAMGIINFTLSDSDDSTRIPP